MYKRKKGFCEGYVKGKSEGWGVRGLDTIYNVLHFLRGEETTSWIDPWSRVVTSMHALFKTLWPSHSLHDSRT